MAGTNFNPLVVVYSRTGNTETFIPFLEKYSSRKLVICKDFKESLQPYQKIAVGTFTWGNGRIPSRMKSYLIQNKDFLEGKEVFIFGSGNSIYPHFCKAVDSVATICSDCGASIVGTYKFEQRFNEQYLSEDELKKLIEIIKKWSS